MKTGTTVGIIIAEVVGTMGAEAAGIVTAEIAGTTTAGVMTAGSVPGHLMRDLTVVSTKVFRAQEIATQMMPTIADAAIADADAEATAMIKRK